MITFTFHIIKLNVLSALMICLTMLLGRITRKHYALQWKYWIWLLTALLLLFPINTSSISAVLAGKCSCAQPHSRHTNSPHASRRCGHLRCSADSCILSWKNDRSVKFHCLRLRPFTALCMDLADRRHHIGKLTYPALPVLALASATLELSGSRSRYFAAVPGDLPEHANQTSTKASD